MRRASLQIFNAVAPEPEAVTMNDVKPLTFEGRPPDESVRTPKFISENPFLTTKRCSVFENPQENPQTPPDSVPKDADDDGGGFMELTFGTTTPISLPVMNLREECNDGAKELTFGTTTPIILPSLHEFDSKNVDDDTGGFTELTFGTTNPIALPSLKGCEGKNHDDDAGGLTELTFGTTTPVALPDVSHLQVKAPQVKERHPQQPRQQCPPKIVSSTRPPQEFLPTHLTSEAGQYIHQHYFEHPSAPTPFPTAQYNQDVASQMSPADIGRVFAPSPQSFMQVGQPEFEPPALELYPGQWQAGAAEMNYGTYPGMVHNFPAHYPNPYSAGDFAQAHYPDVKPPVRTRDGPTVGVKKINVAVAFMCIFFLLVAMAMIIALMSHGPS